MTALVQRNTEGTYSFASQPKAVAGRSKYRDGELNFADAERERYGNLMYDKRVIRGNTYALRAASNHWGSSTNFRSTASSRKLNKPRRPQEDYKLPPAQLSGRLHVPVQTEQYLEALTDIIDEADVECQTDAFLDRPPTPQFVPAKTGADVETQIYEGDLFDFDLEVREVLEVLLGKTLEQALLEVAEEEELANLRAQQSAFEEIRNAEIAEVHRLMEQDKRIRTEKEQRKQQYMTAVAQQKELAAKVAARAFAKAYLSDLQPRVFDNLKEQGYFYDPVEHDIENGFIPWLMEEVEEEMELDNRARALLDLMIREVVTERYNEYHQLDLMDEQRAKDLLMKSQEADQQKPEEPQDSSSVVPSDVEQPKVEETEEQPVEREMTSLDEVEEVEEKEEPTEDTEEIE
ncbi:Radial spoke head protein 3 [Clonorchis sinensis]|uniref:Radial spoke head protein 3 n=1 Tax=Clonorchis sinensis TaxID=79923 RepID=A0A8T1MDH2_CLOSI|nr:Radial spoke head protein 3 [Clonorchis sinensis]